MIGLSKKLSHQLDIQTEQRQLSIERITRVMETLDEEITNLSLSETISILKCLSNCLLSTKDQKKLVDLDLIDKNFNLTKKSKELKNLLKLDAAVLKRIKMPALKTSEIDELFKGLDK